jgi:hypothetical protein
MPSLPDIPGRSLVSGSRRRAGKVAAGSALAVIAVGGYVVRRIVRRAGAGGEDGAATADPIAQTPTAPPGAEVNGADPGAGEGVGDTATAETPPPPQIPPRPDPPKPLPPEPEPPAPEPRAEETEEELELPAPLPGEEAEGAPEPTGTDAPPKPDAEPGDRSRGGDPHHALNNPVVDPDPTEWPDPYEKRSDPLDPPDPDGAPFGEEPHVPPGTRSTSEPHHDEDPEAGESANAPKPER